LGLGVGVGSVACTGGSQASAGGASSLQTFPPALSQGWTEAAKQPSALPSPPPTPPSTPPPTPPSTTTSPRQPTPHRRNSQRQPTLTHLSQPLTAPPCSAGRSCALQTRAWGSGRRGLGLNSHLGAHHLLLLLLLLLVAAVLLVLLLLLAVLLCCHWRRHPHYPPQRHAPAAAATFPWRCAPIASRQCSGR